MSEAQAVAENGAGKKAEAKARGEEKVKSSLALVPIAKIVVKDAFNIDPNRVKDEASIRELWHSIQATGGLLQPILLGTVAGRPDEFHLIAGHRRLAAYKLGGETQIEAFVREFDSAGALIANGTENTCRKAVHPYFLAKRVAFMKDKLFKDDKDAAAKIGKALGYSKVYVENLLRLHGKLQGKAREQFEGPGMNGVPIDIDPNKAGTLAWLLEICKLSPEEQDAEYEKRFGKDRIRPEDKEPEEKGAEGEGAKKKPRKRDDIEYLRDKTLSKRDIEREFENKRPITLSIQGIPQSEEKLLKFTERDRLLIREVLAWCLDKSRGDFLVFTPAEEDESGEDE